MSTSFISKAVILEVAEMYVSGNESATTGSGWPVLQCLGIVSARRASLPDDAPCHPPLGALVPRELP